MRFGHFIVLIAAAFGAEQVFEDSPTLTALWQASSSGSTDSFINQLIQNKESGSHRATDGRGPVFWAYEFKNVESMALLMHMGVSMGASWQRTNGLSSLARSPKALC